MSGRNILVRFSVNPGRREENEPEYLGVDFGPAGYAAIEHAHVYQIPRIHIHAIPRGFDISLRKPHILWYPKNCIRSILHSPEKISNCTYEAGWIKERSIPCTSALSLKYCLGPKSALPSPKAFVLVAAIQLTLPYQLPKSPSHNQDPVSAAQGRNSS